MELTQFGKSQITYEWRLIPNRREYRDRAGSLVDECRAIDEAEKQ